MISRLMNAFLLAAFAFLLAAPPTVSAETTEAERMEIRSKLHSLKRRLIMEKAQQRILRARVAKNPKKKLPKGFTIHPSGKKKEAGVELAERVHRLEESGVIVPGRGITPGSVVNGRVQGAGDFGPNKRANNPATDIFADAGQSETSLAAHGNNILLTWNDGNGFDTPGPPGYQLMSYGYSTDGGATWTDGGTIPTPSPTSAQPFAQWMWLSDPVVAVNENTGEFHFTGLVYPDGPPAQWGYPGVDGDSSGIAWIKGSFSGSNFVWQAPKLLFALSTSAHFYDKQWFAVDPANGNLYLTYTHFTLFDDKIEFRRSTDGGTNWTSAFQLSAVADNGDVQGSRIVVGPNSEVYAAWFDIGPPDPPYKDYMKIRKSTTGGASWGAEAQAVDFFSNFTSGAPGFNRERGITYPGLAVDRTQGPDRGRVYVTWPETIDYWLNDLFGGAGNISEPETGAQVVNNTFATATNFTLGNTLRGTISNNATDLDFFKFNATAGQTCVFYVDSVSAGLDMAFRLFCNDQVTRLAISSLGRGFENLIVFTIPLTGTYYLRPAAWEEPYSLPGPHPYRIRTIVHSPLGSDRSRDHRDVFVASSANGLTWPLSGTGAPTRVNDDPPLYDNWLPEIAITGNSRVFCTWFDWRDAPVSTCGGQSSLHLYRSDNSGTNWSDLGTVTDALSPWTTALTNIAPNQGDYISLFANFDGVYAAWGDARDGNPNVYAIKIPIATPTLASLATSNVTAHQVELDWLASEESGQLARLERRESADWQPLGEEFVDGTGHVTFVDQTVQPGRTYTYRLAFGGGASYSQEARIAVPFGAEFALSTPQPNPVVRDLWISFSLPTADPASLSLVDIAGRIVRSMEVGQLGDGTHRVNLGDGARMEPGVYLVTLRQGERTLTRRVSVVR